MSHRRFINRFYAFKVSLFIMSAAALLLFQNCQGVSSQFKGTNQNNADTGGQNNPNPDLWSIGTLNFMESSGSTVDLKATLPQGVKAGGQFVLDPQSASLPAGMSLSSDGILFVGTAKATTVTGVIFSYIEPN